GESQVAVGVIDGIHGPPGGFQGGADVGRVHDVGRGRDGAVAGGQRRPADRVEERQAAAGAGDPGEFGEGGHRVGHVGDEAGGEDGVDDAVGKREPGGVGQQQGGQRSPAGGGGRGQHLGGGVGAEDQAVGPDRLPERNGGPGGAAAGVENDPAGRRGEVGHRRGINGPVVGELGVPPGG